MIELRDGSGLDTPLSGRHPRQWDGGSERGRTKQHKVIPSAYHGGKHDPASARPADLVHEEKYHNIPDRTSINISH